MIALKSGEHLALDTALFRKYRNAACSSESALGKPKDSRPWHRRLNSETKQSTVMRT